jgi:hypothetical protein
MIILFVKAVKEIQQEPKTKFVAKNDVRDNFFCGPKSQK